MLKLMMLVTLTDTTKVGVTKAFHTKEGDIKSHKVIVCKEQTNYVPKKDVSSPMVLEEAKISKYVTTAHEESKVAGAITLSTRMRMAEGCNKERLIEVRNEAMRPCYGIQVTKQLQPRDMEW